MDTEISAAYKVRASHPEKRFDQVVGAQRYIGRTSVRQIAARTYAVDAFRDKFSCRIHILILAAEDEDGLFKEGKAQHFRRVPGYAGHSAGREVGRGGLDGCALLIIAEREEFILRDVVGKIVFALFSHIVHFTKTNLFQAKGKPGDSF
jgi:hypothetical protein